MNGALFPHRASLVDALPHAPGCRRAGGPRRRAGREPLCSACACAEWLDFLCDFGGDWPEYEASALAAYIDAKVHAGILAADVIDAAWWQAYGVMCASVGAAACATWSMSGGNQ